MPSRIFISYRRDDDPNGAARVHDALAARFGKSSLFMDVDDLLVGLRFDEELAKALAACDVFISIIGGRWMDVLAAKQASGERDYVCEEISGALKRKIAIVPVRIGREGQLAPLPRPDDLPAEIRDLVHYQKHDVTHENFTRDVGALADAITAVRRHLGPGPRVPWGWVGATALGVAVAGYGGAHYAGLSVPWLQPSKAERPQPASASVPPADAEAERQRLPLPTKAFVLRRSKVAGGRGGEPFDEANANPWATPISGLDITVSVNPADRNQRLIGRLGVYWGDKDGPLHGGGPADVKTAPIRFAKDESISKIMIFGLKFNWPQPDAAPVWIAGIRVVTSKGIYSFGNTSLAATECVPQMGEHIIGFFGRSGSYIDQLGCIFARPKG